MKIVENIGEIYSMKKGVTYEKQHEQERKATFAEYGYRTLIIWEHELEDILRVQKKVCEFQV